MNRMMASVLALILGGLSLNAHCEPSGEILEFGYYQPIGELERIRNYNTATGYVRTGSDVKLVEQTAHIPLAKGRLFGFKFRIKGFPLDEVTVNLELVVSHPQITRPNGTQISGYRMPVILDLRGGKVVSQTGYKFDKDYEMVAGEWKFQYFWGDTLLLEKTFHVYEPPQSGANQVQ
jgi:hypothetical protein